MSNTPAESPEPSAGVVAGPQPSAPAKAPSDAASAALSAVKRASEASYEHLSARFPELLEPATRASVEPRMVELLRLATAQRLDQEAVALDPNSRKATRALRLSQRAYRDAALALEADLLADKIRLSDAADQRRRAAASAILNAVVRAASVLAESLVRTAATALLKG